MTLLPIVARELRVVSRRAAIYWTRFTFALLAIVVGSFAWAIATKESPRQAGMMLFVTLSVVAYLYSLLAGAVWTADCVSEEKREGTLGLLFLTDLRGYDVVLGKLAASSITGVYGLLAIFPIMALPLLMGGVSIAEFGRVVLVCVNTIFLSLATGLFCSVLCKDERKSIGLTLLLMLSLTAGIPFAVGWISSELPFGHPLWNLFHREFYRVMFPSPGFQAFVAFDLPMNSLLGRGNARWFYIGVATCHLMGWAALALSAFILPRIWQDRPATPKAQRRKEKWQLSTLGSSEARTSFRRRLLEVNPFYWLASRDRFKVTLVWLWIFLGTLLWLWGLMDSPNNWLDAGTYVWTALLAHSFFKCWVAFEASRRLGADRASGALELLLSTPLSVNEILGGQAMALLRQFGGPVALVLGLDLLFVILGMNDAHGGVGEWLALTFSGIAMFVFDLVTLAVLAMWLSLSSRKPARAGLLAIGCICILPWALYGAVMSTLAIVELIFRTRMFSGPQDDYWMILLWFFLSTLMNLAFGVPAWIKLRTRFRELAMERPGAKPGLLRRIFNAQPPPLSTRA